MLRCNHAQHVFRFWCCQVSFLSLKFLCWWIKIHLTFFFLFVFKFALWAAVFCLTCFKEVSAKVESIISYAVAIGPAPGEVSKESKCLKVSNFCRISTNSFIPSSACKYYIFFLKLFVKPFEQRRRLGGWPFLRVSNQTGRYQPRWQVIVLPILKQSKPIISSRPQHFPRHYSGHQLHAPRNDFSSYLGGRQSNVSMTILLFSWRQLNSPWKRLTAVHLNFILKYEKVGSFSNDDGDGKENKFLRNCDYSRLSHLVRIRWCWQSKLQPDWCSRRWIRYRELKIYGCMLKLSSVR